MALPPGTTDTDEDAHGRPRAPARELLKRIDIGLTTGIVAVLISLFGLVLGLSQARLSQQTAKAAVLPIIDVELGYLDRIDPEKGKRRKYFEVTLDNVGAGIAHIQRVQPTRNGEPVADFQTFEDLTMNGRMRGWAKLTDTAATGYLRAGESLVPHSMDIGAGVNDVAPYLRGDYGEPFAGLDVEVCYCSVFDDCWQTSWLQAAEPRPVRACLSGREPVDAFADYVAQRDGQRRGTVEGK